MGNSIQWRRVTCVPAAWVHLPRSHGIDHALRKTRDQAGTQQGGMN